MEHEQMPWPGPGLSSSDRDTFERVWNRVTRSGGGKSPVEAIPSEEWPSMSRYIQATPPLSPLSQSEAAIPVLAPAPHRKEGQKAEMPMAPPVAPVRPMPPAPPMPAPPVAPVRPMPPAPPMPAPPVAPVRPMPPAPPMPAPPVAPVRSMPPMAPAMPARPAPWAKPVPYAAAPVKRAEAGCISCLGATSAAHGGELQAFVEGELLEYKTYMALAQRCPGQVRHTLTSMAADERRHAKRLCTAYFLISGVRYWPADRINCRLEGNLLSALRNRFLGEQKGEAAYRAAAGRTADPCLKELYLELAEEENAHSWLLRGLLEQM